MGVTDFDTKVAVVVRDDLEAWQRLNVTAFVISGVTAAAGAEIVGEPYRDADGEQYLPLLRQPVLVYAASRTKLATVARRARERVATEDLALVGVALRAPHKVADGVLRGLKRHP
jgi:hypothetical protein